MSTPMPESALPYGIRDIKLTPYDDASGTILGSSSQDLPNMQTFSFSETEEFSELRGDDRLITTHGAGAQVEWELEAGGITLRAWAILTGGDVIESGVEPNREVRLRKFSTAIRPFFRVEGQAISDSGGDVHAFVYRCKINDTVEGEFADGEFFVTSASGVGMPMLNTEFDLLYDFVQNETAVSITTTPTPNPENTPETVTNLSASNITSTSVDLDWDDAARADSYQVEQSTDSGSTWTEVTSSNGGQPTASTTTVAGLTSVTAYQFRVYAVNEAGDGEPSNVVDVTTA